MVSDNGVAADSRAWLGGAATVVDYEVEVRDEIVVACPAVECFPLVGAHEPVETGGGMKGAEVLHNAPAPAGWREREVEVGDGGVGNVAEGGLEEREAFFVGEEGGFALFKGRACCRKKEDALRLAGVVGGCCDVEMPCVDGIKGSAKEADGVRRGHVGGGMRVLQTVRAFVGKEATDGELDVFALAREAAVVVDEIGEMPVVSGVLGNALLTAVDENVEVQLGVQVGGEHAAVGSNGAYLVAALDELSQYNVDFIKMAIEGLAAKNFFSAGFTEGVTHDDDFAPAAASVGCVGDETVANGVDGISQVGVAASYAVPVLSQVAGGGQSQPSCFVVAFTIRFANGVVEPIGQWHKCPFAICCFFCHGYPGCLHACEPYYENGECKDVSEKMCHA